MLEAEKKRKMGKRKLCLVLMNSKKVVLKRQLHIILVNCSRLRLFRFMGKDI